MHRTEFETHRWSRLRNDDCILECVIASVRSGWTVFGYEARLYRKGFLIHRSRTYLTRKGAIDEADALLRETLFSLGPNRESAPSEQAYS
jgi:hypothetical protein